MEIRYCGTDMQAWDTFVDQHPDGTIYHKSHWKIIIEQQFAKKTFYICAVEDNEIKGILPLILFNSALFGRFIISIPYVNYGGMLATDKTAEELLLKEAAKIRSLNNADFTELRTMSELHNKMPVKTGKVTLFLDLPNDSEVLFSEFKAKLRSQIRRPIKEGMYAKAGGLELLDDYYHVFCHNMRDLGTPVYSKSFFKKILTETPQNSNIVSVYEKKGKPVGCAFLIGYKERLEIPWASTLKEYNRYSPNMLLYWEVLKFAIENGYKQFDFGRCTKDSGTHRFKKQWGAKEHQLYWYYQMPEGQQLPEINPDNPKYKLAISIWQKLPLFATRLIGPQVVKNLP